jgi:hypothetical protein
MQRRPSRAAIPAVLLCLGWFLPAVVQAGGLDAAEAGACGRDDVPRARGATVRLENDLFAGTDQNYTNGVGVTVISEDIAGRPRIDCLPMSVRLHARLIQLLDPGFWVDTDAAAAVRNVTIKLGQSMYTPADHARADLIADDRPYAGLLYVGQAWNRRVRTQADQEILDTREVTLGVIGPWSLAEQSQNLVHDAIGSHRFLGWDHQLRNEPAFRLALDRKVRSYSGAGAIRSGLSADTIRSLGLRLGNIETSAALGIEGRIGWNLPNDFGSYPIRPGAENRPPSSAGLRGGSRDASAAATRPRAGAHLFGIVEAKAVAWDFSLDGNLFRASHSVRRRPWVVQAAFGLSGQGILAGRGYRLAVMHVWRTREFDGQARTQAHGSIAVSVEY